MDQAEQLRNMVKMNRPAPEQLARVITVTSGKGGVGKSNVAINLGVQFKRAGQRVLIFDADFGLANIEVMFGTVPEHNLSDMIHKGKSMKEIVTWGPMGIGFISGGSGISSLTNLQKEEILYLVRGLTELDSMADTILIDTGAGISDMVMEFLVASREVVLVTTPEPTSITDSYSLLKALSRHPGFRKEEVSVKVVCNRVSSEEEGRLLYRKLQAVVKRYLELDLNYLGYIPQDDLLARSVMQQTPITIQNPGAKASKAFERLAGNLLSGAQEDENRIGRIGMKGFFTNFVLGKKHS